jgi:hypothetical protein
MASVWRQDVMSFFFTGHPLGNNLTVRLKKKQNITARFFKEEGQGMGILRRYSNGLLPDRQVFNSPQRQDRFQTIKCI